MRVGLAALVWSLAACGGSSGKETTPPPPVVTEAEPEPAHEEPADDITVEGAMGTVDKDRVQNAIESRATQIDACYKGPLKATRYVGGTVELEVKVDATGAVTSAKVAAGDLGAWPVEKCLLELVRAANLGKPSGGPVALTRIPLERQGRGKLEDATDEESQVALEKSWKSIEACEGAHAGAQVVLYVAPSGQVTSAGFVAMGEPIDDAWADCAHAQILGWKLPAPRGKVVRHRAMVP